MCQFNFLVLKEKSNSDEIEKIASEFNLNFIETKLILTGNKNIKIYLTTSENCDCGSVIGKNYSDDNLQPDWNKERKKLERKKFSKRRIDLLIKQKQDKFLKKNSDKIKKEKLETKKWTDFINDDRLKNETDKIGILYHQFSGKIENEKIKIDNETIVPTDKINFEFLKGLKENQLIWTKIK